MRPRDRSVGPPWEREPAVRKRICPRPLRVRRREALRTKGAGAYERSALPFPGVVPVWRIALFAIVWNQTAFSLPDRETGADPADSAKIRGAGGVFSRPRGLPPFLALDPGCGRVLLKPM